MLRLHPRGRGRGGEGRGGEGRGGEGRGGEGRGGEGRGGEGRGGEGRGGEGRGGKGRGGEGGGEGRGGEGRGEGRGRGGEGKGAEGRIKVYMSYYIEIDLMDQVTLHICTLVYMYMQVCVPRTSSLTSNRPFSLSIFFSSSTGKPSLIPISLHFGESPSRWENREGRWLGTRYGCPPHLLSLVPGPPGPR